MRFLIDHQPHVACSLQKLGKIFVYSILGLFRVKTKSLSIILNHKEVIFVVKDSMDFGFVGCLKLSDFTFIPKHKSLTVLKSLSWAKFSMILQIFPLISPLWNLGHTIEPSVDQSSTVMVFPGILITIPSSRWSSPSICSRTSITTILKGDKPIMLTVLVRSCWQLSFSFVPLGSFLIPCSKVLDSPEFPSIIPIIV